MAGRNYLSTPAFRFLADDVKSAMGSDAGGCLEFDEADFWNSPDTRSDLKRSIPSFRVSKKWTRKTESGERMAASSLPVSIPDWSKILRGDYKDSTRREFDELDDDDDDLTGDDARLPPHEFLAKQFSRTRIAFSVHEGRGRTLKGRDLRRVRNAIWEKTGFED